MAWPDRAKMSEGERLFAKLQNLVVDNAIPLSENIRFNKHDRYDFFVVCSYLSILEKAWAILALVDRELGTHSLSILRSQLDVFADLTNLLNDRHYLNHLELRRLQNLKERLIAAKAGNPYLASIAKEPNLENELSKLGKGIKKFVSAGAKNLNPSDKMKLAGLKLEHTALYSHLSDHIHGDLGSMLSRHLKQSANDFEVVAFPEESKDECVATMQTSLDIVLRASSLVHSHFDTGHHSRFDEMILIEQKNEISDSES